jgi:hypothetical protein
MSNHEGPIDDGTKGIPLKLVRPIRDLDELLLQALHHCRALSQIRSEPDSDILSLNLLIPLTFKLGLEGANSLLRDVTFLVGLVTLLASRVVLQAKPLHGLGQPVPLLAQPLNRHGTLARPHL